MFRRTVRPSAGRKHSGRNLRRASALLDALEPRTLFAYDVAFVDASVPRGTYSPGQSVPAVFTFRNLGNDPSPATKFLVLLGKNGIFDNGSTNPDTQNDDYGGVFSPLEGIDLPAIPAGESRVVELVITVSIAVFNGGPYNLGIFTGFQDQTFLLGDSDPVNNFGVTESTLVTITGGIPRFPDGGEGGEGGNPEGIVGKLDPTFGDNGTGIANSSLPGLSVQALESVFDPASGAQFTLARRALPAGGSGLTLLKFDTGGRLDTSYGVNGALDLPLPSAVTASPTLLRLPSGALRVAATSADGGTLHVTAFAPNGDLDNSFGTAAVSTVALDPVLSAALGTGATLSAADLAAGPGGSLYVAGTARRATDTAGEMALLRLTAAGVPDTSFNTTGAVIAPLASDDIAAALVVDATGRVTLAGGSITAGVSAATAVRFSGTGVRDLRYGVKGLLALPPRSPGASERFTAAAIGPRDVVFLAGYSATGTAPDITSRGIVAQVTAAGRLNTGYGTRGVARLAGVAPLTSPNTLNTYPDGSVTVTLQIASSLAGAAAGAVGVATVRLDAKGQPLTTFGTRGITQILPPDFAPASADLEAGFSDFLDSRDGAAVETAGGKLRAVATRSSGDNTNFRVAQLNADGVDLVPTVDAALPGSVFGGSRVSLRFSVANRGTLVATGQSAVSVTLVPVATGGQGNPAAPQSLGTTTVRHAKLAPSAAAKSTLRAVVPAAASGLYSVIVRITPTGVADLSTANNTATAPSQTTVSPRFADLGLDLAQPPTGLTAGATVTFLVNITNSGTIPATGRGTLQLFLTDTDDIPTNATPLSTLPVSLPGIPASGNRTLTLRTKLPANFSPQPGQRLALRLLTPPNLGDTNPANNDAFSDVLIPSLPD